MSIAPRYGLGSIPEPSNVRTQGDEQIQISIEVDVGPSSLIQSLHSPSHTIAVTIGKTSKLPDDEPVMHKTSASLALGRAHLDKDFVLVFSGKNNGTPTAFLEASTDIPNRRALMVDLVPKFPLASARPEILPVTDRSYSMRGQIPTLISALKVFLMSLPMGIRSNICSFGDRHSFLWPKSRLYNEDLLDEATYHIQSFKANFGGTKKQAALEAVIGSRLGDIDCEVLVLTDNNIWDQDSLFDYLNRATGNSIRVFALGIGSCVSSALIEGVARAGLGFAQMVDEGEKLDKKVVRMLKGALMPHIWG